MSLLDDLLKNIKDGLVPLFKDELKDFLDKAEADAKDFLYAVKDDLVKWSKLLAEEKITVDELKFLVQGKKDLAAMNALTEAGLAAIRIDKIRITLIDIVIDTIGKGIKFG